MIKKILPLIAAFGVTFCFCYFNTPWFHSPQQVVAPAPMPTLQELYTQVLGGFFFSLTLTLTPLLFYVISYPHLPSWIKWRSCTPRLFLRDFAILYGAAFCFISLLAPQGLQNNLQFLSLLKHFSLFQITTIALFICLLVPLAEEILYRGILLHLCSPWIGLLISTCTFAIAHGLSCYTYPLLLIGWTLGLITLRSHSILPSFLLHASFNTLNFIGLVFSN